jgi:hypothetical protein
VNEISSPKLYSYLVAKCIYQVDGDNGQTKKWNNESKFNYSALVEAMILLSNLWSKNLDQSDLSVR